ncbi:LMBR1-like membrane protein [Aureococcus anophagefferens]|nr:LMBR1-like membrane protein [Aureococcus anophagefferens]
MYVDVYWICFAMSLAGLPYAEEYDASGHVAALGKLLDSGRRMAVMWLAMGLGGLLFLGLVLGSGEVESADAFNVTLIACSNTANSLFANLKEASVACSNAAGDAIKTLEAVDKGRTREAKRGAGGDLSFFAAFFDVSLEACAAALREDCAALGADGFRSGAAGAAAINKRTGDTDADAVADCRRRLAAARAAYASALGAVDKIKARTFYLEDLVKSRDAGTVAWSFGAPPSTRNGWLWHCRGKPILLKCAAVCAAVASACLLVSQIGAATANTSAALDCSAFAVMARSGARRNGDSGAAAASLLCGKLAAPLLYNYLATLHEVGSSAAPPPLHDDDARRDMRLAFDRFYSAKMDAVTPHFDRVAASLVVVVALLHAGNMLNRLLVVAKLPGYQFGADLAAVDAGARRSSFQAASDAVRELASPGVETARLRDERLPDERRGWLSKKAPEHLLAGVSTGWSKRYFCLRAPGELAYFKHEGDDEPVGVVDLRLRDGLSGLLAFDTEAAPRDRSSSAAPPPLEGALALKKPHKFRADTWARRYVVVDGSKGELALFYSAADAKAPGKRPYLAFDLRVCGAFAKHDKGAKSDPARFSVDVGDHSVKLKAPTAQDAGAWVAGLRKWQDHILLGTAASMV